MRKSATLFIALGLAAGLTACSAADDTPKEEKKASATDCLADSGSSSEAVTVDGEFGAVPTVSFDFPVKATKTERTVLVEGDGDVVASGDVVSAGLVLFSGTTGEELLSSGPEFETAELPVNADVMPPGMVSALQCSPVGSRIVAVIPSSETGGIAGEDSIVMVADVVEIVPPLTPAEWTDGVPEVELGDKPTVTLPDGEAPADLLLAVLEEGDGAAVKASDTVTLDYQGTSWQTGEVFDESYGKQPITHSASGFVKGFNAALVGQKVGSTLLVTIPAELAYGPDAEAHQFGGQDLLFLIQIRDVA